MADKPTYAELQKRINELERQAIRYAQQRDQFAMDQENLRIKLANAIEMAHLGPWEYDVIDDLFIFNDQFFKMFHTTAEQVGGYTMSSAEYTRRFLYPDDAAMVGDNIRFALETADPEFSRQLEHRIFYADGTVGYISVRQYG